MSSPQDGPQVQPAAPVDSAKIWTIRGGVAGVLSLVVATATFLAQYFPIAVAAGTVICGVGVVMLYRWGTSRSRHTSRGFIFSLVVTLFGALVAGFSGGFLAYPGVTKSIDSLSGRQSSAVDSPSSLTTTARSETTSSTTTTKSGPQVTTQAQGKLPAVRREEHLRLNAAYSVDLDATNAESAGVVKFDADKSDVYFYQAISLKKGGVPIVGEVDYAKCYSAGGVKDAISREDFQIGKVFCVKTTEGRWARVEIKDIGQDANFVDLVVKVWEKA